MLHAKRSHVSSAARSRLGNRCCRPAACGGAPCAAPGAASAAAIAAALAVRPAARCPESDSAAPTEQRSRAGCDASRSRTPEPAAAGSASRNRLASARRGPRHPPSTSARSPPLAAARCPIGGPRPGRRQRRADRAAKQRREPVADTGAGRGGLGKPGPARVRATRAGASAPDVARSLRRPRAHRRRPRTHRRSRSDRRPATR